MTSADEVVLDLNHRRVKRPVLDLLGVNHDLRRTVRATYAIRNRVVVRLMTSEVTGTFCEWQDLRSWCSGTLGCLFPKNIRTATSTDPELASTIDLNFALAWPTTLADVRVGVVEFIRLTYRLRPHSVLCFSLQMQDHQNEVHVTTLETLRKAFFVFISSIMNKHPNSESLNCPEVWIDGHGNIIEGVYAPTEDRIERSWPNEHSGLTQGQLLSEGLKYAQSLEAKPEPESLGARARPVYLVERGRRHNNGLMASNSLRAMWKLLRDLDWPEERTRGVWLSMPIP
jgi:hypothetical protein